MADKDLSPAELRDRLWKELDEARIVMLGLVGGEPHHMQPMAAFGDQAGDAIWFFTKKDTALVGQPGASPAAELTRVRLDPREARVWGSRRGPISYPLAIAKANATHSVPDISGKQDVTL